MCDSLLGVIGFSGWKSDGKRYSRGDLWMFWETKRELKDVLECLIPRASFKRRCRELLRRHPTVVISYARINAGYHATESFTKIVQMKDHVGPVK